MGFKCVFLTYETRDLRDLWHWCKLQEDVKHVLVGVRTHSNKIPVDSCTNIRYSDFPSYLYGIWKCSLLVFLFRYLLPSFLFVYYLISLLFVHFFTR
jgi:hypothetical protein